MKDQITCLVELSWITNTVMEDIYARLNNLSDATMKSKKVYLNCLDIPSTVDVKALSGCIDKQDVLINALESANHSIPAENENTAPA